MRTQIFESWADDIQSYALENYNSDGWDYIVECFTLDEIIDEISSCYDYDEALKTIESIALSYDERRAEVRAEI